jgi:PIN domain nuclease of toxin-antitoxin system
MRILLDTCDFLWFISGDPALPALTRQEVQSSANEVFLSVVSFWEIVIKHALGKLPLPQSPEGYIPAQRDLHGIRSLPLEESSVRRLVGLPSHHRDPFDRMLVCQAQAKGMHLASSDPLVRQYPVTLL